MTATKKPAKTTAAADKKYEGFTAEEKAAMKERAKELKASQTNADNERDVLAKIAEMPDADRVLAEKVHGIIKDSAPVLAARLWYGMPAYAKDGKIVCHFAPADKFNTRYATFAFSDQANLDDGAVWPTSFALAKLSAADAKKIGELVKQAVS
jgi:uncharacterized protein YdhG (YjbR/CyaY superfamily)